MLLCRLRSITAKYDIKQSNGEALGNAEFPFIKIAPRSTLARSGST